jgi:hypothetical protein
MKREYGIPGGWLMLHRHLAIANSDFGRGCTPVRCRLLGEDFVSESPLQTSINRLIGEFSTIIQTVGCEENVSHVPIQ